MLRSKRASAGNDGLGRAESRPSRIGPISLGMKQMGARSAGNPHAACDVAGAGNAAWSRWCDTRRRKSEPTGNTNFDLNRRASPRPYHRPTLQGGCAGTGCDHLANPARLAYPCRERTWADELAEGDGLQQALKG